MEVGQVLLTTELDTSKVEQQIEAFRKRLETIKIDVPVSSIGNVMKQINSLKVTPRVDHKPLTDLNKHLDKKVAHVKQVNTFLRSNPLKVKYQEETTTGGRSRNRGSSQSSFSTPDFKEIKIGINEIVKILTVIKDTSLTTQKQSIDGHSERKKQSTKLSHIVKNTKQSFFRNISRGFQEGIGMTYAQQGATSFLKGLKYEERLGLVFQTFGEQVVKLGERVGNIGFEAIFGVNSKEFFSNLQEGLNEITKYINSEIVENLNQQIDDEIVSLTKNLLSIFTKGQNIPKNLKQIIALFDQIRQETVSGIKKRKISKAKEQADIIRQQPIPKYDYDPNKEKTVIVSGGFAGSGGDAAKDIMRVINQMYKGQADLQKIITNFTDVTTPNKDNLLIWTGNALARIVEQSVGLGFNPDAIDMVLKTLASKQANPDRPVELVGYSAGGYVVNEALAILKELGITDVKGVGIGTPTDIGVTHDLDKEQYTAFLGDKDGLQIFRQILKAINLLNTDNEAVTVPNVIGHNFEAYGATPEVQKAIGGNIQYTERQELDTIRLNPSDSYEQISSLIMSIVSETKPAIRKYLIASLKEMLPSIKEAQKNSEDVLLQSQNPDIINELTKSLNFLYQAEGFINQASSTGIDNSSIQMIALAMAKAMKLSKVAPVPSLVSSPNKSIGQGTYSPSDNTIELATETVEKITSGNFEQLNADEIRTLFHEMRHFFQVTADSNEFKPLTEDVLRQQGVPDIVINRYKQKAENSVSATERKAGIKLSPVNRQQQIDKEIDAYFFADTYGETLKEFFLQLQQQAENIDFSDFSYDIVKPIEGEFFEPLTSATNNQDEQEIIDSNPTNEKQSKTRNSKLLDLIKKELQLFFAQLTSFLDSLTIEQLNVNNLIIQDIPLINNLVTTTETEVPSIEEDEIIEPLQKISSVLNNPPSNNLFEQIDKILKTKINAKGLEQLARFLNIKPSTTRAENERLILESQRSVADIVQALASIDDNGKLKEAQTGFVKPEITPEQFENIALPSIKEQVEIITANIKDDSSLKNLIKQYTTIQEKIKWIRKHNQLFNIKGDQNSEIQGQVASLKYLQETIKSISQTQGLKFDFDVLDSLQSASHQFDGGIQEFIALAQQAGVDLGDEFMSAFNNVLGVESPSKKTRETAKFIVLGFLHGLKKEKTQIINGGKLFASGFLGSVDKTLEIKSPSKKMWKKALQVAQGFANGLRDNINLIETIGKQVSEQISNAINPEITNAKKIKEEIKAIFNDLVSQTPLLQSVAKGLNQIIMVAYQFVVFQLLANLFKKIMDGAFEAALQVENLQRQLSFATGKNGVAELQRIRKEADAIGISFIQAAEGYRQFTASTIGTSLNENAGEIVSQFQKSFAAFGLTNDQQEGAFVALSQMASKGIVSMEELRQQLAERLPGALQIAASSMGMTTGEFIKLVESGQVLAEDLLPSMAKALESRAMLNLAVSAKSTQAELTRMQNNIFNIQAEIGKILVAISKIAFPVINKALEFVANNIELIYFNLAILTAGLGVSILVKGVSYIVAIMKALGGLNIVLQLVGTSLNLALAPILPFLIIGTALTLLLKNWINYFQQGSKEIKNYTTELEKLKNISNSLNNNKQKPEFSPRQDADLNLFRPTWASDDYGFSGYEKGLKSFSQATKEEWDELVDFITMRSQGIAKAFNENIELASQANQSALEIYQNSFKGTQDIDLGNNVTVKNDYSDFTIQQVQKRLDELRTIQANLGFQIAVNFDQGDEKLLQDLTQKKAEVEKEIARIMSEPFGNLDVVVQSIQTQEAIIQALEIEKASLQANKNSYSEKNFKSRMDSYNLAIQEAKNRVEDLRKVEEKANKAKKEAVDLYSKQLEALRKLQRELANINYTTSLLGIDGQIKAVSNRVRGQSTQYELDVALQKNRRVEIDTKLKLSQQSFADFEQQFISQLNKIDPKLQDDIGKKLGVGNIGQAILSKQISPETLNQLLNSDNSAIKEYIEKSPDLKALIENGSQYLNTWQEIKQTQLESVNLIKEQQDALQDRVSSLRDFARSLEDLDTATRDFLVTNLRAKEDIDVAVRDYRKQQARGLEDFARQTEDASIQYQRQQRDLVESYQDLNRQLILQTFQIRKSIDETSRDIAKRTLLNDLRKNLRFGEQGLFGNLFDAIEQFLNSQDEIKNEELTLEEQRLQVQEDIVSLAKQIRGMQEQMFDMERQRILQIRDLTRQQVDLIDGQLDAQRNITRQLEDFAKDNKERLKAITRQFEDMELQARSMGITFDNVFKAFNGINTNYGNLNKAITGLIGNVNKLREDAKKELENSRKNPNIPQVSNTVPVVPTTTKPSTTNTGGLRSASSQQAMTLINNLPSGGLRTPQQQSNDRHIQKLIENEISKGNIVININQRGEIKSIQAKTVEATNLLATGNINSRKFDKPQTFVYDSKVGAQLGTVLNNFKAWFSTSAQPDIQQERILLQQNIKRYADLYRKSSGEFSQENDSTNNPRKDFLLSRIQISNDYALKQIQAMLQLAQIAPIAQKQQILRDVKKRTTQEIDWIESNREYFGNQTPSTKPFEEILQKLSLSFFTISSTTTDIPTAIKEGLEPLARQLAEENEVILATAGMGDLSTNLIPQQVAQANISPAIVDIPDVSPLLDGQRATEQEITDVLRLNNTINDDINLQKLQQRSHNLEILKLEELSLKQVQLNLKATETQRQAAVQLMNTLHSQLDILRQTLETYRGIENEVMKLQMNAKGFLTAQEQMFLAQFDVSEKYRTQRKAITDLTRDIKKLTTLSGVDPRQMAEETLTKLFNHEGFKSLPSEMQEPFRQAFTDIVNGTADAEVALANLFPKLEQMKGELDESEIIELKVTAMLTNITIEQATATAISNSVNEMLEGFNIFDRQRAVELQIINKQSELRNKHLERRRLLNERIAIQEAILDDPSMSKEKIALAQLELDLAKEELATEEKRYRLIMQRFARETRKASDDETRQNEIAVNKTIGEKQKEMNPFGGGSAKLAEAERLEIAQRYADEMERINKIEESGQYSESFIASLRRDLEAIRDYDLSKIQEKFSIFAQAIREPMQQAFTSLFSDVVRGTKSIGDVLNEFLNQIANFFANIAAQMVTNSMMGFFKNLGIFNIAGFKNGGTVSNAGQVNNYKEGGVVTIANQVQSSTMLAREQIDKVANFAKGGEVLDLGIAVHQALKREGKGGVPVVAHIGEQILTTRNGDAQLFRQLERSGQWDRIKSNFKYKGDFIPNFNGGGAVGMVQPPSMRTPQGNPQGVVYNYAINVTTKDADSFRKSQSLIAQEQKLLQERRQRFN